MKNFPVTVVDDFYDDVDKVREFALSLPYEKNQEGSYPGKRTKELHEIAPKFFEYCTYKFFSLHFDFLNPVQWRVSTSFQLTEPYAEEQYNFKNLGWIHKDIKSVYAGVVYLTPNADEESGTRIYRLKDEYKNSDYENIEQTQRFRLYRDGVADEAYKESILDNHNHFNEILNVKNYYNRMICFDSQDWHGVKTLHSGKPRLTQTFFVFEIDTKSRSPYDRMRDYTLKDEYILPTP